MLDEGTGWTSEDIKILEALLDTVLLVFGGKLRGWGTGRFLREIPDVSSIEESLESDTFNLGLGTGTVIKH